MTRFSSVAGFGEERCSSVFEPTLVMDERLLFTRELSSLSEDATLDESNELVADGLRECCTWSCSDGLGASTLGAVVVFSMIVAILMGVCEKRLGLGSWALGGETVGKSNGFVVSPETTIDGDISCEIVWETVMSRE